MAYFGRAAVWKEKGKWDQAIHDYDRCLANDPRFAPAFGQRGLCLLRQGQEAAAQADFAECLRLNPTLKTSLELEISKINQHRANR